MTDIDPRLRTELGQRAEQIDVTGDFAARAIAIEGRAHRRRVATAALGGALALAVGAGALEVGTGAVVLVAGTGGVASGVMAE